MSAETTTKKRTLDEVTPSKEEEAVEVPTKKSNVDDVAAAEESPAKANEE